MLEICCSSVEDAINAENGGADRIELCSAFSVGGLTPSNALIKRVSEAVSLPVRVLIRPREGHFVSSEHEKQLILGEALGALDAGADGVVIGSLAPDGTLDEQLLESVLPRVPGEQITFHRAFDEVRDQPPAYRQLTEMGISCVLTSGGAASAIEGLSAITTLLELRGQTQIMAGGGVRPNNVGQLLSVGVRAVHFSARKPVAAPFPHRLFAHALSVVDPQLVSQMRDAQRLGPSP